MSITNSRRGRVRRRASVARAGCACPGDKSISHRALLFAATGQRAQHRRRISRPAKTSRAMRAALDALGVGIARRRGAVSGDRRRLRRAARSRVGCSTAATAAPRCACCPGVLAGRPFLSILSGDASLNQRPMRRVTEPLRAMGAARRRARRRRARPAGDTRGGSAAGMRHDLAGCERAGEVGLDDGGPAGIGNHRDRVAGAEPRPQRADARGPGRAGGGRRCLVRVRAGAPEPFTLEMPGDPSSAAFFVVAAAITPGSDITVESACRSIRPGSVSSRCCAAWAPTSPSKPVGGALRRTGRQYPGACQPADGNGDRRRRDTRTCKTRYPCSRSRPRSPTV